MRFASLPRPQLVRAITAQEHAILKRKSELADVEQQLRLALKQFQQLRTINESLRAVTLPSNGSQTTLGAPTARNEPVPLAVVGRSSTGVSLGPSKELLGSTSV